MWNDVAPIRTDWPQGSLAPSKILYSLDGPAFFLADVGLLSYAFFKKDELEEGDLFLACIADHRRIEALVEGRLSIRGALACKTGWLVLTDVKLNVVKFQEQTEFDIDKLLPRSGIALRAQFGQVPDSLVQVEAFMAFKFFSSAMNRKSIPLSILAETVEGVSKFVKGVLTPAALLGGRDGRFFDVRVNESVFASLLIAIEAPEIDVNGLLSNKRTANLKADDLRQASANRGAETWEVMKTAVAAFEPSSKGVFNAADYREFFDNIVDLVPADRNEIDKLEITINRGVRTEILSIDKTIGQRFVEEHENLDGQTLSIEGVITEVNGESGTFLLRDNSYWITTCNPQGNLFQELDDDDLMNRGQRLRVKGRYWRRKRRGFLTFNQYPTIL